MYWTYWTGAGFFLFFFIFKEAKKLWTLNKILPGTNAMAVLCCIIAVQLQLSNPHTKDISGYINMLIVFVVKYYFMLHFKCFA